MTAHEVTAQSISRMITVLAAICLTIIICRAPVSDAADNDKARVQVAEQARAAAQPDTWGKLDRQSKQMVAFDRIKK